MEEIMRKKQKKLVLLAMTVVIAIAATGCGNSISTLLENKTEVERAQDVVNAYQTGDIENFKSRIEKDNTLNYLLDALDDTEASGMTEVYQKVHELTKTAEITIADKEDDASSEYAVVTIKGVDFSKALNEAMMEAAQEGGEAFADVPSWMMKALNTGGEEKEVEVEIRTHSNGTLYDDYSKEFFSALTGGFYRWIGYTMTTCSANNEYNDMTYMLAKDDIVKLTLDEYVLSFEGEEVTDEEIAQTLNEYVAEYEDYDGMTVGGNRVEGGLRMYILIDYDEASFYTLQKLGIASGGNSDTVGLNISIEGFEEEGYTCETTDFGSGVLEKSAESTETEETTESAE